MTQSADLLLHSEVESRRFGLKVCRGFFADDFSTKEILAQILGDRVDVAIIRIPSARVGEVSIFEQRGIPTITADSLVYYSCELKSHHQTQLRNTDLEFEPFSDDNIIALDELVARCFSRYTNHYSANPLLRAGLLPGYQEWARSYADSRPGGRFGWLAKLGDQYVGFITCSRSGSVAEIVLNGVIPEAEGAGVYGDLVRFTQRFFKEAGCRTMKVSTQVQNFAVQKVWSREGFVMNEAYATVHLNALLSASVVPKQILPLVVTADDVAEFGRVSGDLNPLHFSDDAARELGFEQRIAHGLIATGFLSKFYGNDFPGEGTIFAGFRCAFSGPVYLDRQYSVEITFPFHDRESGRWLSLARIFDPSGEPCLLAYADLINRRRGAPSE